MMKTTIRKPLIAVLFMTGVALLVYALFLGSTKNPITEWKPVNEPLKAAVERLSEPVKREQAADTDRKPDLLAAASGNEPSAPETEPAESVGPSTEVIKDPPVPSADSSGSLIDLNRATQSELETLPGIGPSKAKAIIAYREKINGFRQIDQLRDVKGIGPKVYERISGLVRISQK
ncbi:ComEA family DNA-binding protein [Cohnella terricola]|nr:ComEA family DNA-binding protein [Cohnella terricola]